MIYYKLLMTRRILMLLICFIPILITAQEQNNEGRGDEKQEEKSIFLQGGAAQQNYFTVVPYDDSNMGLPIITVEIKGEEYRFLFDTGAITSISERLLESLNLELLKKDVIRDAEGRVDSTIICFIEEISLGDVLFRNIPSVVLKEGIPIIECLGIDGIVGSNQMRESIVRFSSKDKTITITDQEDKLDLQSKSKFGSELFLEPIQCSPYVWFQIDDNDKAGIQSMFDSGMTGVFDIALRHLSEFEEHDIFSDTLSQGVGSVGHGFHGKFEDAVQYRFRVPRLWLNPKDMLKNVSFTSTRSDNSRFGMGILKYGDITIDYKNKGFIFEAFSVEPQDLYEKFAQVSLNVEGRYLIIGVVWDQSLSAEISVGDQILAINDFNLENMDECQLFRVDFEAISRDSNVFKIRDKSGNIKEVLIKKE